MTSSKNDNDKTAKTTASPILEKLLLPVVILVIAGVILGAAIGIWKLMSTGPTASASSRADLPALVYSPAA